MRWRILAVLSVSLAATGCVGPGQYVRHGHYGGYHHCGGGGDGVLALLDGVAAIAEVAADVSDIAAASNPQPPTMVVVEPPPPPEPVRPLPPWFQARVVLPPSSHGTLPMFRIGLKPASAGAGSYLAIFDSDELGRFSFAAPPPGSYTLVVLDSDYQGTLTFASDGKSAFPLVLSAAARAKPLAHAAAR